MKHGYTKVAVILDRSGSMHSVCDAMISGFNEFINGLKQQAGECTVFLCQFDDPPVNKESWYEVVFNKPLNEVPMLTRDTYVPRGGTPLIDALGMTIDNLGKEFEAMPDSDRPEHVIVLIITDGEENASSIYGSFKNKTRIAQMVKHQQEKYNWVFTFMGANQDAVLQAAAYNIPTYAAMNYAPSIRGSRAMSGSVAMFSNSVRSGSSGLAAANSTYTKAARTAAMATDDIDASVVTTTTATTVRKGGGGK